MEAKAVKMKSVDRETWLEAGMTLVMLSLLGAVGVLVVGRSAGSRQRTRLSSEPEPTRGEIPASRHRNVQAVSAR